MVTLQDIADLAGCSRTTVSNVINGNTSKVSQKMINRVHRVMNQLHYVPEETNKNSSTNYIGFVVFREIHGRSSLQDAFVAELITEVKSEVEKRQQELFIFDADNYSDILPRIWNLKGLIMLGFTESDYHMLKQVSDIDIVMIDTYPEFESDYTFYNVGIDDFDGGYQVGIYLLQAGYKDALFLAENKKASNLYRWNGFRKAMESEGATCSDNRYIVIGEDSNLRKNQYEILLNRFLEARALAFSSDFNAVEAINNINDFGYKVPQDIAIVGFDDNIYAQLAQPKLTTVRQNVSEKAKIVVEMLLQLINDQKVKIKNVRNKVHLVKRDSA